MSASKQTAKDVQHDQQFSFKVDRYRCFVDTFGGGDYELEAGGEVVLFEWSEQFGPLPITKKGGGRDLRPRHPFWRAVSLWKLQGMRIEGKRAIWHEPKKPVLKHLGGRNYMIVEPGEPGHDY